MTTASGRRASGRWLAATLAVGVAWTCGPGGVPDGRGAADAVSARTEIEIVTRRWEASLLAGVPDQAVPDVFTSDAVRLPSGAPAVRGHPAIARALAGSAPLDEARFTIEDLEVDGDLAFANGVYRVRNEASGELTGKFLEVWKRTPGGWRIHRVMWD